MRAAPARARTLLAAAGRGIKAKAAATARPAGPRLGGMVRGGGGGRGVSPPPPPPPPPRPGRSWRSCSAGLGSR